MKDYYLIMLAAGFSRRFGSNKLLYEIDGKPMYAHTFEKLDTLKKREDVKAVIVVSQYENIEQAARDRGFIAVHNAQSELGISSSLKEGLKKALELSEDEDPAFMYLVGDQPYLKLSTIETMLDRYEKENLRILCLTAEGKRGNPVIFAGEFASELLALTGDTGGKQVIKKHPEAVTMMDVDAIELADVDHL